MSVYQVEEYYIFIQVPESKKDDVVEWLDNNEPMCTEVSWCGNELTIDNFECEGDAEHCNQQIIQVINY